MKKTKIDFTITVLDNLTMKLCTMQRKRKMMHPSVHRGYTSPPLPLHGFSPPTPPTPVPPPQKKKKKKKKEGNSVIKVLFGVPYGVHPTAAGHRVSYAPVGCSTYLCV